MRIIITKPFGLVDQTLQQMLMVIRTKIIEEVGVVQLINIKQGTILIDLEAINSTVYKLLQPRHLETDYNCKR